MLFTIICHIYYTFCYNLPISDDDDDDKNTPIPNDDDGDLSYIQNLHYVEIWK